MSSYEPGLWTQANLSLNLSSSKQWQGDPEQVALCP